MENAVCETWFKCKIYVDITNDLAGQSERLAGAHFVFGEKQSFESRPAMVARI
jgi:hypothetical protein